MTAICGTCRNGHLRTIDNTLIRGDQLVCRECNRESKRRADARKKAARVELWTPEGDRVLPDGALGRPIPTSPDHLATRCGRIFSQIRGTNRLLVPKELAQRLNPAGYPTVRLRGATKPVHRLVAITYLGDPQGRHVRHMDGNRRNPHVDNLKYGTPLENAADRWRHGTMRLGEEAPNARWSDAEVAEAIRLYLTTDLSQEKVAALFGTNQSMIGNWVKSHQLGRLQRTLPSAPKKRKRKVDEPS